MSQLRASMAQPLQQGRGGSEESMQCDNRRVGVGQVLIAHKPKNLVKNIQQIHPSGAFIYPNFVNCFLQFWGPIPHPAPKEWHGGVDPTVLQSTPPHHISPHGATCRPSRNLNTDVCPATMLPVTTQPGINPECQC